MQKFLDSVALSGVKETSEGYLIADAFTVRTGIQQYAGFEVGRPELAIVRVYRPEGEVFSVDSLKSFAHVPVTNDHPSVPVTADNWREYAVGEASTDVLRDGERLRIPLVVKDKNAIADVRAGKRELSAGYSCDLAFESGTTPSGETYDAVQRNIRANHIAIVARGRAGTEFRIGDAAGQWGVAPLSTDRGFPMQTKTIVVDGITIVTTDQGAEAIAKIQGQLNAVLADKGALVVTHTQALEAKDAEIGQLKVQLDAAQKAAVVDVDALVAARSALVDAARKIVPDVKVEGVKDADLRKAVVVAKLGDAAVVNASDAEIGGMFKALTATVAPTDPVRTALQTGDAQGAQITDNGQAAYEKRLADAWKGGAAA